MRICIAYDCLFPYTIGGAERWYRNVATQLAREGHRVTYLTLRQWPKSEKGEVAGIDVVSVGPKMSLYGRDGQRRILPPIIFGLGVLWWLAWRSRRYDVVHVASFPYFSVLAAGILRCIGGYRLIIDWHEFWSEAYWRQYLGSVGGTIGWMVQGLCLRVPHRAFCFAQITASRLRAAGFRGELTVLEGEYAGSAEPRELRSAEPLVMFAGRHIPEKRPTCIPAAIDRARAVIPDLKCQIYGDGPERAAVLAAIADLKLQNVIEAPGFVTTEQIERDLSRALCLLAPSAREGYGLVVVEASARGVPTVLVKGEDNAATELIEEGVNGFVADSASPTDLAAAIVKVWNCGPALRHSTSDWFIRNARRLSLETSLQRITAAYASFAR
jgi:glycosyltransferase involved in cell wall biosynthesis